MLNWSDIRGQERPLGVLERALEAGRAHHAYLFTGLRGVGKFTTAYSLAAVINCHGRPQGQFREACGSCPSCRKIVQEQHPDVMFVRPQGRNIKIDQIREVQKAASVQPYEIGERIVLIDDAHAMTEEAANALLKTLEEPSTRMRLILVTDQAHRLLDTIISRCQRVTFGALDEAVVVELLGSLLRDDPEVDEPPTSELLAVAAGYGEGSLGRSLEIVRSGMLAARRELVEKVAAVDTARPAQWLDLAESLGRGNRELEGQLDVLKLFFRDIMLFKASGSGARIVNRDLTALVEQLSERLSMPQVLEAIEQICEAQDLLTRNVNSQLIMEDLLRQIADMRPATTVAG